MYRLNYREHTDPITRAPIHSVGVEGTNVSHMYFTNLTWSADSRYLMVNVLDDADTASYDDFNVRLPHACRLAAYDTHTGEAIDIAGGAYYQGAASPVGTFLYTEGAGAFELDFATMKSRQIGENPQGYNFYGVPSVTNDGAYMTVYWHKDNWRPRDIGMFHTKTGAFTHLLTEEDIRGQFAAPDDFIDHPMVNPMHPDQVFYCRNGAWDVPDRMWTVDVRTGHRKNIYRQQRTTHGVLGEGVGHEMWSSDGEWLYFMKYFETAALIPPFGIMRTDRFGQFAEFVNGDYKYNHASVSADGRYLVADVYQEYERGHVRAMIVLIDTATRRSKLLARVGTWWNQPGHVHPSFDLAGRLVTFTFADENKHLRVGYIDLDEVDA